MYAVQLIYMYLAYSEQTFFPLPQNFSGTPIIAIITISRSVKIVNKGVNKAIGLIWVTGILAQTNHFFVQKSRKKKIEPLSILTNYNFFLKYFVGQIVVYNQYSYRP